MERKVLLVEDDPDMTELLAHALRSGGHDVTTVSDGRSAVRLLMAGVYDLVVLDLRLPKVDGVGFLSVLRAYRQFADLPVIVVTASGEDELERLAAFNVQRVFHKHELDIGELIKSVAA